MTNKKYLLSGAQKQAAASVALAYPERKFIFATDQPVIDGWDLPNVNIISIFDSQYDVLLKDPDYEHIIVGITHSIWQKLALKLPGSDLFEVLKKLKQQFPENILPVYDTHHPLNHKPWIIKGKNWHKQDAIEIGDINSNNYPKDPFGCGLLYQEYLNGTENYQITGKVSLSGGVAMGMFRIFTESCARDDMLIAGESISSIHLQILILQMIEGMGHKGYFTFNVVNKDQHWYISSFRPLPKGLFKTFREGGVNLLDHQSDRHILLEKGKRFICEIHYAVYHQLPKIHL